MEKSKQPTLQKCASATLPSTERLCPLLWSPSLSSLPMSSSSSADTVCSFPEPCPGATADLAAQERSGPAQTPKDDQALVENLGPALGQDPPLERSAGTSQGQVSGDEGEVAHRPRDVEPDPDSHQERVWTLFTTMWLEANGVQLPAPDTDTERIPNTGSLEMGWSSSMMSGSSTPVTMGSTIWAAPGGSSPAEPSPQQRVPTGRMRAWTARGLCKGGRALRESRAQLCRRVSAWWKRDRQCCCRCSRKPLRQNYP
ncbi:uncharacterized protein LOC141955847 [Athene noctua]|uniref:uncharacterized protein LOC141955847 n=1 Tax=Athene noctua TaxID=126797 RepID=UPI003EB78925